MLGSGRSKAIPLLGGAAVFGSLVVASPAASTSVIAEIPVGNQGWTVATDTVYPGPVYVGGTQAPNGEVLKINPDSNTVAASILFPGGGLQTWVATGSSLDDSVYAVTRTPNSSIYTLYMIGADDTIHGTYAPPAGFELFSPAVRSTAGRDDTVYVGAQNQLLILDASTLSLDDTVPLTGRLEFLATVGDDSVVATSQYGQNEFVYIINPNTDDSIAISSIADPFGVAVSPDQRWAYVASFAGPGSLYKINVATGQIDDSVVVGGGSSGAWGVAVAPSDGTIYLTMSSGTPGAIAVVDPATFDVTATIRQGSTTGAGGQVSNARGVAVGANGRAYASGGLGGIGLLVIGTSSPTPPAPPAPVFPPDAPRDVKAVGADGQATVTWTAPVSSGSFPITNYLAKSSPGGKTCLVAAPALTCTVTGLTNGTAYTFTAEALNGAGWSAASAPSAVVTPTAGKAIVITGSRDASDPRLIVVRGTSSGLAGAKAVPFVRLPGQTEYSQGTGTRTIGADGTFGWQRKTGKKAYVYFTSGDVKSNTVVINAR